MEDLNIMVIDQEDNAKILRKREKHWINELKIKDHGVVHPGQQHPICIVSEAFGNHPLPDSYTLPLFPKPIPWNAHFL